MLRWWGRWGGWDVVGSRRARDGEGGALGFVGWRWRFGSCEKRVQLFGMLSGYEVVALLYTETEYRAALF